MAKVIEFYVRDLFPKKVKPVARDRCGEVIQFPKDRTAVASNTPKIPEGHEGKPFAALGLDAFMRSAPGEEGYLPTQSRATTGGATRNEKVMDCFEPPRRIIRLLRG